MSTPPRQTLFTVSGDIGGALWVNRWDGFSWWANMGTPPGSSECSIAGCVETFAPPVLHLLVTGDDQHVWSRTWDGTTWSWVDAGALPHPGMTGGGNGEPSAVTLDDGRLCAVFYGFDAQLSALTWDGAGWTWSDLGSPAGVGAHSLVGSAVIYTVSTSTLNAVVVGTDHHLWVRTWDGATGGAWTDHGAPVPAGVHDGVGVVEVNAPGMDLVAVVRGGDGQIWARTIAGSTGTWTSMGEAPDASVDGMIGTGCLLDTDALGQPLPSAVIESALHLWLAQLGPGGVTWTDLGAPATKVSNGGGIGAGSAVDSAGNYYLFATVFDLPGHLWLCRRLGGVWTWTDLGPQGKDAGGGWNSIVYSVG